MLTPAALAILALFLSERGFKYRWWHNVFHEASHVWVAMFFCAGALLTWLQLRSNHPAVSPEIARWFFSTGWNGQQRISGFCIHLHGWEIAAVVLLIIGETVLTWSLSAGALLGWVIMRLLVLGICLPTEGLENRLILVAIILLAAISFYHIPIVFFVCIAVGIWLLEIQQRESMVQWADRVLALDATVIGDRLKPRAHKTVPMVPWQDLHPVVHDPRPKMLSAALISVCVAAWSFCLAFQTDRYLIEHHSLGEFDRSRDLQEMVKVLGLMPVVGIVVWRISWFNPFKWYPSPGLFTRFLTRRPFVRTYDLIVLSLIVPLAVMGVLLTQNVWQPVQLALAGGVTSFLLLTLGPDPVNWQLTSNAELLNTVSQTSSSAGRGRK